MAATKDFQKLWSERAAKDQEEALKKAEADQKVAEDTERAIKESHLEAQKVVDEIVAKEKKEKAEAEEKAIKEGKIPAGSREETPALPTNPSETDPSAPANLSNPVGAAEKKKTGTPAPAPAAKK